MIRVRSRSRNGWQQPNISHPPPPRPRLRFSRGCDWDELRDHIDLQTGGDYDATQLDILTDMVKRRLPNR